MASSALMGQQLQPIYFPLLDDPVPPGVRNLQHCIEDAWSQGTYIAIRTAHLLNICLLKGFDEEGAEQLKGKLVGTSKWIGTAGEY